MTRSRTLALEALDQMPSEPAPVRLCPVCALWLAPDALVCAHHLAQGTTLGVCWSDGNRIWCDFFHRGIVPKRVPGGGAEWWSVYETSM